MSALRDGQEAVYRPLVSVITPTYNHAHYIGRCIESLLAQTYTRWEMVVVDDGSTDNTAEVVQSYRDPRITYVYQRNRGVAELATTINTGLGRTTGELVTMLASDDTWPPYRLEKQAPVFRDPDVALCFGRGWLIDEDDNVLGEARPAINPRRVENRPPGTALHDLFVANFIPQYTVLIRRSALEKVGGYIQPPGLLAEDYPTHMALALHGEFRCLDLPLGSYRMHRRQMTRSHYLRMVETDITYVMQFFSALAPEIQRRTGWNQAALGKALASRLSNSYFEVGRRDLLAADWQQARRHLLAALLRGNLWTKVKSALGLLCSLVHTDMEGFARLIGRTPLR